MSRFPMSEERFDDFATMAEAGKMPHDLSYNEFCELVMSTQLVRLARRLSLSDPTAPLKNIPDLVERLRQYMLQLEAN